MSLSLSGPHGLLVFNKAEWSMLIELAMEHGFTPKEKIESVRFAKREWSVEEIKKMANAIRHAILSIPDDNTYPTLVRPVSEEELGKTRPRDFFSGMEKGKLDAFITFCLAGEFDVEYLEKINPWVNT